MQISDHLSSSVLHKNQNPHLISNVVSGDSNNQLLVHKWQSEKHINYGIISALSSNMTSVPFRVRIFFQFSVCLIDYPCQSDVDI